VVRLADGVPQLLKFHGAEDLNKLLMFNIPDGDYTFQIQIKSLSDNFYPKLYVKYYEDIDSELKGLEFPPGGPIGFFICKNWDYKLKIMSYQEKFENIRGGKSGLALNLVDTSTTRAADQESLVYVTVSATPVLKMALGQTYIGSLEHSSSYRIY